MKAKEIVEQLEQGKLMKELEVDLNISQSTIRTRLKKAGYVHDEGKWQLREGIEMDAKTNIPIETKEKFTQEEIIFLKKFVKEQSENEIRNNIINEFADEENELNLFERIRNIDEDENRERNNIFISESVHDEFTEFLKVSKLKNQKSLIVEIALIDFLKKYNK
ncbi:hypothetical protein GFH33_31400 (plasmid) [Bacillus thuringiensis]|uniref:hypothetical protein n=1 Tax=Bacillus thuringiensis TaxID=1428 RepID=UPI001F23F579|nr:hypothetical protein [Bacillus thuringiensis]MCE9706583.1 hypothetical protein [Bacillus thuringiensis]UJT50213.1 hypothetical protein GFH33_31530 [Bacillus thuringiensis]UJT50237.1 hypothetical protein GFH33_31400 [Bacillus thuringiensis]